MMQDTNAPGGGGRPHTRSQRSLVFSVYVGNTAEPWTQGGFIMYAEGQCGRRFETCL